MATEGGIVVSDYQALKLIEELKEIRSEMTAIRKCIEQMEVAKNDVGRVPGSQTSPEGGEREGAD
jgi:hypothetical protein